MKAKFAITSMLTAAAVAIGATFTLQQPAQASTRFVCARYINGPLTGVPVTAAVNDQTGRAIPVINWVSRHFDGSGYTPERRCQEVSSRFQSAYVSGQLNFVTTGMRNGQPVICTSSASGGPCSDILYTLKPGSDASQTLQQLFDIQMGRAGAGPLNESESRPYLDMNRFLSEAPSVSPSDLDLGMGNSGPTSSPGATEPATTQPSGGMAW
ncbi:COP23 domain-containing protein [Oscillatoria sp. HE19RPO]|uniref:COP23 domain-containing protein n=1 Tax=Oscillatoria sp. HE19RPO TaxID=2954806 RepID=UPI0020C3194A|nr:COP23 domain-containing protein [Oscillatoria sp. HE19RPO]